ncbi:MAG TPA: AraC family transcriptional regulator [Xanthomonadaceae bacterium]|jgi:AraC family transcriptional regulator|nr:AraC family transcriptional regulator [Xanthomonadaceae bacterium]
MAFAHHKVQQTALFGRTVSRRDVSGFGVSERLYKPSLVIPHHEHELASLNVVLAGGYDERYGTRSRECHQGMVVLHPEGEHHAEVHHAVPVRMLAVEISAPRLKELRQLSPVLMQPADFEAGSIGRLAGRLSWELRHCDAASALAIEAIILEMLAESCRHAVRATQGVPIWVERAHEFLHAHFAECVTIEQIAAVADVHPAHLSRVFRKVYRCTIGEYQRRLRLESTRDPLVRGARSLADIASQAGFADQSHFSRLFVAAFGMTPSAYRRMHRRR